MSKIPIINQILSGFSSNSKLNENFNRIAERFSNTLSRDGSSPNFMNAPLDMNGFPILNAANALETAVIVAGVITANQTVFVGANRSVSHGSSYNTIQDAVRWASNQTISSNAILTIKVDDGVYTLPPGGTIDFTHSQGAQVQIIGNQTSRDAVHVIYPSANAQCFIRVSNGANLGLIDGFTVESSGGWISHGVWNEPVTPYGCGILNFGGGRVNVGPQMYFNKCYYGVRAEAGGVIVCSPGVLVNESGDVAYHAYNGGHIEASGTFADYGSHASVGLGSGYLAEFGSTIKLAGSTASHMNIQGAGAYSGSTIWAENVKSYNNQYGLLGANGSHVIAVSDGGSTTEIHDNQFGVRGNYKTSFELGGALIHNNVLDGVSVDNLCTVDATAANIHDNGGLAVFANGGSTITSNGNSFLVNNGTYAAKATNGGQIRYSTTAGPNGISGNVLGFSTADGFNSFVAGVGPINYPLTQAGPSKTVNFDRKNYVKFISSLFNSTAPSLFPTKILLVGDSTTSGVGAGDGGTIQNAQFFSTPVRLARYLTGKGIPTTQGVQFGDQGVSLNGVQLSNFDLRFTYDPAVWTFQHNALVMGGSFWTCTAGTSALNFAPRDTVDSFDIFYAIDNNSSHGTLNIQIDGAAPASGGSSVNTSGPAAIGTVTVKASALGTHTLNLTRSGTGAVYVIGVRAYNSAQPGVSVYPAGISGATAVQLADNSSAYSNLPMLQKIAPDLTIVNLGLNDMTAGTPSKTFRDSLTAIVTAAQASGPVLMISPTRRSDVTDDVFSKYTADIAAVSLQTGCALLDLAQRFGDGQWVSTLMSDVAHPNRPGYDDIAHAYSDFIMAL